MTKDSDKKPLITEEKKIIIYFDPDAQSNWLFPDDEEYKRKRKSKKKKK